MTLWEHRLATKRLHEQGRRTVDEHAIFAAAEEQRRVLAEAYGRSKAARRAVVLAELAVGQVATTRSPAPMDDAADDGDGQVRMPAEGAIGGVEFW